MGILNQFDVIDSFNQLIPGAAGHSDGYLREVAKATQEQGLPVEMNLENNSDGLFAAMRGQGARRFLVVQPLDRKARGLRMMHYGFPVGTNLTAGWLLTGTTGNLKLFDYLDLTAVIESVHGLAVAPALYSVADSTGFAREEIRKYQSGFFGV
ncbi:hypothetical protein ACFU53_05515 [Streptomyces sp. NPDC057474]|uniref:hypothetical protein n=1 Tax=Streptomyces sp. NPDC057474 TaxID=3346144 RepID=UPI0036AC752C